MIGWKRIVITVGERIGKDHLTYGQVAAAEISAMATIGAGLFRPSGQHHARAVIRCSRHDVGQQIKPPVGDGA
jgi:hypothetical protein